MRPTEVRAAHASGFREGVEAAAKAADVETQRSCQRRDAATDSVTIAFEAGSVSTARGLAYDIRALLPSPPPASAEPATDAVVINVPCDLCGEPFAYPFGYKIVDGKLRHQRCPSPPPATASERAIQGNVEHGEWPCHACQAAESRATAAEKRAEQLEEKLAAATRAARDDEPDKALHSPAYLNMVTMRRERDEWRLLYRTSEARAEKAESKLAAAEASAGAMRSALETLWRYLTTELGDWYLTAERRAYAMRVDAALASDAGSRLLARVKRLEAVAEAARKWIEMGFAGERPDIARSRVIRALAALDAGEGDR